MAGLGGVVVAGAVVVAARVDMAHLSFKDQLSLVASTDVLVGVCVCVWGGALQPATALHVARACSAAWNVAGVLSAFLVDVACVCDRLVCMVPP
jgi:hypothetical protein